MRLYKQYDLLNTLVNFFILVIKICNQIIVIWKADSSLWRKIPYTVIFNACKIHMYVYLNIHTNIRIHIIYIDSTRSCNESRWILAVLWFMKDNLILSACFSKNHSIDSLLHPRKLLIFRFNAIYLLSPCKQTASRYPLHIVALLRSVCNPGVEFSYFVQVPIFK